MERIIVSSKGFERLKGRFAEKSSQFDEVRAERQRAFEMSGDGWHDNPYFNRLQQQEAEVSRQLAEAKRRVGQAQIVEIQDGQRSVDVVRYGSIVRLRAGDEGQVEVWEVVGFDEGDVSSRKLSYASPLGRALIGCEPGDCVEVAGKIIEIISLHGFHGEAFQLVAEN